MKNPALAAFKPDAEEACRRWEAYWAGDLIGRPILLASLPKPGYPMRPGATYRDRVFGDLDRILADHLYNAAGVDWLGEALPAFWTSFGTHEIANFCGAGIVWPDGGYDTNWSEPFVTDWAASLPLRLDEQGALWRRMLDLYRRSVDAFSGRVLAFALDFHTNMDLLLSVRGDTALCLDVADEPGSIDRAMEDARRIFAFVWNAVREAGRMDDVGYWSDVYSEKSCTTLACDFSALIGPASFRRWVLPTLEYEASLVDRVRFHWDGPAALRHFDDLCGVERIHTVSFVPNPGERHLSYLGLLQRVQARGKSVEFNGTPEEIRAAHRELDPTKTIYRASVSTVEEFRGLERWLVDHT